MESYCITNHITDTLASFHWLKAPEHVQYKLATVVYRSLNGMAPSYLAKDVRRNCLIRRPGDVCGHHWPISWMSASRRVQLLETEPTPLLVLGCGTVCQQTLLRVTHFLSSTENLKHFCSGCLLLLLPLLLQQQQLLLLLLLKMTSSCSLLVYTTVFGVMLFALFRNRVS